MKRFSDSWEGGDRERQKEREHGLEEGEPGGTGENGHAEPAKAPAQAPIPGSASPPGRAPGAAQAPSLAAIKQLGQAAPPPVGEPSIYALNIVGQIEGHILLPPKNKTTKYEHLIPQMIAIEQNPQVKGLLIILNTVGGDIEAGLAIAEMIKTMSKPTVSLVLGGGHSIGVPIAVAADYSFIAETATMTIHPIRLTGLVIGVPQTYEYLDKMQDRIIHFIVEHSRMTETRLRELMFRTGELVRDIGTVLIGRDAVREGLIASVGGLAAAVNKLEDLIAENDGRAATDAAERELSDGAAHGRGEPGRPKETDTERRSKPRHTAVPVASAPVPGQTRVGAAEHKAQRGREDARDVTRQRQAGTRKPPSRSALSNPPWTTGKRGWTRRRGPGESLTASLIDFIARGGMDGQEGRPR